MKTILFLVLSCCAAAASTAALGANAPADIVTQYEQLLANSPNDPMLYRRIFLMLRDAGMPDDALRVADMARARFGPMVNALANAQGASVAAGGPARTPPPGGGGELPRVTFHGTVRAGIIYDSNANQGPASDLLDLGDWTNVSVAGAKKKGSAAAYFSAGFDLGFRLNDRGSAWLVGDASGLWRGNANSSLGENGNREWQNGRAAFGFRVLNEKNLFDLRLKAEVFDYEFDNRVSAFGTEVRYVHAPFKWLHLNTAVNVDRRVYNRSGGRNGIYTSAGQYARFIFGTAGHEFSIGGSYLGGDAEVRAYRYHGWQASARFSFRLPHGFTVSPSVAYGHENYKGPATALETARRRDKRFGAAVDIRYDISPSWFAEAAYRYSRNRSNSQLYQYDQHVVSAGMGWRF